MGTSPSSPSFFTMLEADAGVTPRRSASALVVDRAAAALLQRVDRLGVVLDRLAQALASCGACAGRGAARRVPAIRCSPAGWSRTGSAKPARMPGDGDRPKRRAGAVADRREQLLDHLHDRARTCAEQECGNAGVERGCADPGADDRGRAGDEAEQRERASDGGRSAIGATIASPSVVLWIANPITRKAPSASAPTA